MSQTPRIQNMVYVTSDMKRARSFYEALIGPRLKFADGDRWTQYDIGGRNFALGVAAEAHPLAAGACIIFEVISLVQQETRLIAAGGRILQRRDMGAHGEVLVAADPDGNIFQLWQRRNG